MGEDVVYQKAWLISMPSFENRAWGVSWLQGNLVLGMCNKAFHNTTAIFDCGVLLLHCAFLYLFVALLYLFV